ncbi:MAG TPA: antibiotic biosynthesis monooxygenase [Nannocystaceae bacterium]|nr:antibiotic biosynthesis monooxygenase [Nannocystaceae bacterium]
MANTTVALVVRLVAKPGREEKLGQFLAGALPLAQNESFTPVWYALRSSADTFWIVDAFADDGDRSQHLGGDIARALMAHADELLALPPEILKADVLAAKLPG